MLSEGSEGGSSFRAGWAGMGRALQPPCNNDPSQSPRLGLQLSAEGVAGVCGRCAEVVVGSPPTMSPGTGFGKKWLPEWTVQANNIATSFEDSPGKLPLTPSHSMLKFVMALKRRAPKEKIFNVETGVKGGSAFMIGHPHADTNRRKSFKVVAILFAPTVYQVLHQPRTKQNKKHNTTSGDPALTVRLGAR